MKTRISASRGDARGENRRLIGCDANPSTWEKIKRQGRKLVRMVRE